jgi:hypothetical protein
MIEIRDGGRIPETEERVNRGPISDETFVDLILMGAYKVKSKHKSRLVRG